MSSRGVDIVDPDAILCETFVEAVEWLNEVDSTNSYAVANLDSVGKFPLLVGADSQTTGRGRGNNRWWGGVGSLTFTLVLKPHDYGIPVKCWPLMSMVVGLAVREGLLPFLRGHDIQLKWPNDVYVDSKKICGVLIETVPSQRDVIVLGVGVNVNNSMQDAPEIIQHSATSVTDLSGSDQSRQAVLVSVLRRFEEILPRICNHSRQLLREWEQHCFLTGKKIEFDDGHEQIRGVCLGIDPDGGLVVQSELGTRRFLAGSITVIQ